MTDETLQTGQSEECSTGNELKFYQDLVDELKQQLAQVQERVKELEKEKPRYGPNGAYG